MTDDTRGFKGVWVCAAIFLDEGLSPAEKMLLAEIDSLTTEDHGCYASNAHFGKRLGLADSRANHVLARLTRDGYVVRVCCDGRTTQRVVAPEYSSNPATSRRLIQRQKAERSRVAKNSRSELSQPEDSNSDLSKIATLNCQKQQVRPVENSRPLILEKVPIESTNRKRITTTTTHEENKPVEASSPSSCAAVSGSGKGESTAESSRLLGVDDGPNANGGRRQDPEPEAPGRRNPESSRGPSAVVLAEALSDEFRLSRTQQNAVAQYCESHGNEYVMGKAAIVRSAPRKNAAGALLAALREDWQPAVSIENHHERYDELAQRMGWEW